MRDSTVDFTLESFEIPEDDNTYSDFPNRTARRAAGLRRSRVAKLLTGKGDPVSIAGNFWQWIGGAPAHSPDQLRKRARMSRMKAIRRGKSFA